MLVCDSGGRESKKGMGFRLNPKWVFSVHPQFPSNSSSSSSSPLKLPFVHSSTVRVAEASFLATRSSFPSSITEEEKNSTKDPLKACICESATPCLAENVYVEVRDPKVNFDPCLHSGLCETPDARVALGEERSSAAKARLSCSMLQYNLLMKNLFALEETFLALDSLSLEKDIMIQLGRLGALELFNTCLSRTLSSSDLSDTGEHLLGATGNGRACKVVASSGRKLERKAGRARVAVENGDENSLTIGSRTMWNDFQYPDVSRTKRSSRSRKKRAAFARNEAEMSTGVKIVANLERIRTMLEEEMGKPASLSCWAEAAGMNKKVLLRNLQFGWYCRDELLKSTRSLVLFLARNYRGLGIAHDDLIQAGNVGVLQGAERFDHTRGYKFSTYVQYWIRKSISMAVSQHARGVHIPSSINRAMNQIQKARKTLKTSRGMKHPSDEEIAKLTGLTLKKIRSANQCLRVVGSIDQKVGDCISTKFLELTADTTVESPEETVMRQSLKRDIRNLLELLEPRERQVMILRFGLRDYQPKSLEEIGRLLSVSKEWIRRIERKAMGKLRDQDASGDLRYYLNS